MKDNKKIYADLETLVAFMPGHVYWLDKNNVYQGCNDLQAKAFGLKSRYEIVGKTNADLCLNANNKALYEIWDKNNLEVLQTGIPKVIEEIGMFNGLLKNFLTNKVPLYDKKGEISGLLGISVDISDRKEQIEITFEQMIAHMPGHVYWLDKKNIYLGCNDLHAKHAGFASRQEIVGKTNYDLPWKDQAAELDILNLKVMETGEAHIAEEFGILADGKQGIFLSQKVPLRDKQANIIGVLGISMDITQLKTIEKALAEQVKKTEKAYQSKTMFLQTVSHEVRGPVSNILQLVKFIYSYIKELRNTVYGQIAGVSENVKADKLKLIESVDVWFDKLLSETNLIESEAQKTLDALINLGDLHHIELEGIKSKIEAADVVSLIDTAISNFKVENTNNYLEAKKVIESVSKSSKVPEKLLIDKTNLFQVLKIVIGNAIKYSHENGRVIISVDIEARKDQEFLTIKVEDFGVGISDDHLSAILSALVASYEDIEQYRYKKPSLKLTQAKLRIEASGGKIDIKSSYGKGTVVILKIPFAYTGLQSQRELIKPFNVANNRVLLMEDDALTQLAEKRLLEECGCSVDVVSLGLEAIKAVKSNNYRAAFLDITVPDVDGLEVMKTIKSFKPNLSMVAVTSHASKDNQAYFQDEGFDAVLTKPVDKAKLKEIVEIIFDNEAEDE